ncbi:MAG: hypothetical protein U9R43_09140 [Thermodesulfobacteriota bacterium]|nr:hypothetical protein [Thermodesulfobacteriota bacterium]
MLKLKFLVLIIVFFFIGSFTAALGEDSIGVNQIKRFKGGGELQKLVKLNLQTDRRTRVQIMVTKGNKVLENHKLVVGCNGICEGKFKGAQSWGYLLPEGTSEKDLEIFVSVHPLAGNSGPIVYTTKATSAKDSLGFCLSVL